jgi:hypothetical protein
MAGEGTALTHENVLLFRICQANQQPPRFLTDRYYSFTGLAGDVDSFRFDILTPQC